MLIKFQRKFAQDMRNPLILGIMQPYFFPYLGHFSLIASTDEWIVFDISQYTPKTWMSRNRILHPNLGWQYISVPLSNSTISIKTFQAKVLSLTETRSNIAGKLSHYKNKAPYFDSVKDIVNQTFDLTKDDSLVGLNVCGIRVVCDYLGLPFNYKVCSELNLKLPGNLGPGDWAPEICNLLGATGYVNPESGKELFEAKLFKRHDISLYFAQTKEYVYDTAHYTFEPNLSILDVLMWNSPDDVSEALRRNVNIYEEIV